VADRPASAPAALSTLQEMIRRAPGRVSRRAQAVVWWLDGQLGVTVHLSRPDAFEGRWTLTLEPHGFTMADVRDGQMLGSNCTTYRHQLFATPSVSPSAFGRCDNHHR
jgi:hypothetical protein